MNLKQDVGGVVRHFQIAGEFLGAAPHGNGHINGTYCVTFKQNGGCVRYLLQQINLSIFKDPAALMENIQRVTAHLGSKYAGRPDRSRRGLTLVPSRDGAAYHRDAAGNVWRCYVFIERARTFDVVASPAQAFKAAQAFGQFQTLLADLPAPRLHDTIPDFHHTPKRFAALETALAADTVNRAKFAQPEIEFALRHKTICPVLLAANLPERVTHNDTKLNNVLLDDATGEGICVVDLDTVMPGLAPYDFGDLVRSAANPAKEDERDLSKVEMRFPLFEALARGYLSAAGEFLTPAERKLMAFSSKLITFELGLRFLTDFLSGDVYFKVRRDGQNLDRCRAQFKLMESIAQQEEAMNRLVSGI
jgi:hypothetical protein